MGDEQAGGLWMRCELVDQGFQRGGFVAKERDELGGVIRMGGESQLVDLAHLVQPGHFLEYCLALRQVSFSQ